MHRSARDFVSLLVCAIAAIAAVAPAAGAPVRTCTSQNAIGYPYEGTVCGGATYGNCTPGAIYRCTKGPLNTTNNCTLSVDCAIGCLTGQKTTPVTANTQRPRAEDACFFGSPPLTVTPTTVPGGGDLTVTTTLSEPHNTPQGPIVNFLVDDGTLVPPLCDVPLRIPVGQSSVTFDRPTAVVSQQRTVRLHVDISFIDTSGIGRDLLSIPTIVTLNAGGTEPPAPPIASFTLSPSTIAPGGLSVMEVTLLRTAPARGIPISVTSADPSVASVILNGQPFVQGGCTHGGGAATIEAAQTVAQTTTISITASSGAPGQTPPTRPLTVTGGCDPSTCLEIRGGTVHGGPCGSLPDGCGGFVTCGCDFGETCGGAGVVGECGLAPSLTVASLALQPASVVGGASSTGTVTMSGPAPPGGAGVFLSSSSSAASVPPSVVVPESQTTATFPVTTTTVPAVTVATISASHNGTKAADLTIEPAGGCQPTTCTAQGKNCGTISDGCGGTLSCGTCSSPQTCGGAGVPNVCGGGGSVSLSVTATGRGGERVRSSPVGIDVPVGQTQSATFGPGTSITLSATNSRDVIWSGACSSNGRKAKTCTFTIQANSSVTANVQ